ncbi:putative glycoside hydrolase [Sulfurimonas sp. HSL-1716]|uniref:putative glycoside hydrolase n=1 Tax=Hydrocurvibacter sulfurireducens TaxID=3131937 RepID=UPI0031F82E0F
MMKILFFLIPISVFASISGVLIDKDTNSTVSNAKVFDTKSEVLSDKDGRFTIDNKDDLLHIKAYGYRPYSFKSDDNDTKHYLQPIRIKALYLSFWGARINSKTLKKIIKMIDDNEINAVVVDIKNEFGWTSYKTDYENANKIGAWKHRTIKNIDKFMKLMKEKNIYTIGRVVVFKDELRAVNFPQYALKESDGKVWRNRENMAWVDPYISKSYDYVLSIAADAAKRGFDEINFDYIRFPAKLSLEFSKKNSEKNRIDAIGEFIQRAQEKLRPYGTFISVDTYGNVCWADDDTNIGHTISSLARYTDYLSPMLYPSGFASGSFGFKNPAAYPYETIYRSVKHIHCEIAPNRIRPWLQAFKDYAFDKRYYKRKEIQEQIKACADANTSGWMFWNPSSRYDESYFIPIDEPSHVYQAQNR